MARRIRVLDQGTINKIAAGEVVESPASVVKELIENSMDADASDISVEIMEGGMGRITVTDDGVGMSREDVEVAFTRHSTSKIVEIEDLSDLSTLGFRGEALASIGAVAQVEMVTRERGARSGTRVVVSAGKMYEMEDAGCPEGTRISVSDLFENVPARKSFLRSRRAERSRCTDVVSRFAMVHPEVGFKLEVEGQEKITAPPTDDARERAAAILGPKTAKGMIALPPKRCGKNIEVAGLVSLPWETRGNSAGITISVNGRVIKNRGLVEAVRKGYGPRLMKARFPLAVIHINISGTEIDVNVHPTKDIVKFSREANVFGCLHSAISEALFRSRGRKNAGKRHLKTADNVPDIMESTSYSEGTPTATSTSGSRIGVRRERVQSQLVNDKKVPDKKAAESTGPWEEVPAIEGCDRLPPALPENAKDLRVRIIGQLDRSYILCELGADLLLVDQHAAHERIRLEALRTKHTRGGTSTQELLEPIHIELDPPSMERIEGIGGHLNELGFVIEDFGEDCVVIRGLPQFMGRMEGHEVVRDLAMGREDHEGCTPPDGSFVAEELPMVDRLLALAACRGAIKAHQRLSLKEMEDLIGDLLECEVPLHCAHGRPTMIRLPLSILERWFKRVI